MGYYHFTGARGWVQLWRHQVLGMEVWEARLPGTAQSRLARRRLSRGLARLEQAGCRRLLTPCPTEPDFPQVHTRSLWQAMAAPLALAALEELEVDPRRAVVALHGERMTRNYVRACVLLARQVRALSLALEREEPFCWSLQQELGLPLVEGGGDVTVSFLPGSTRPNFFSLGDADPVVTGYTLHLPGLHLPPGCPELPVLAALLEAGRLPQASVRVMPQRDMMPNAPQQPQLPHPRPQGLPPLG